MIKKKLIYIERIFYTVIKNKCLHVEKNELKGISKLASSKLKFPYVLIVLCNRQKESSIIFIMSLQSLDYNININTTLVLTFLPLF